MNRRIGATCKIHFVMALAGAGYIQIRCSSGWLWLSSCQGRLTSHAHDDGGVHIDRVRRVLQRHGHIGAEHHLQAADVALGAIGDEDVRGLAANGGVETVAHGLAHGALALLCAVPAVAFQSAQTVGGVLHRLHNEGGNGLGGVANSQGDDLGVGVGLLVGAATAGDLRDGKEAKEKSEIDIQRVIFLRCRGT